MGGGANVGSLIRWARQEFDRPRGKLCEKEDDRGEQRSCRAAVGDSVPAVSEDHSDARPAGESNVDGPNCQLDTGPAPELGIPEVLEAGAVVCYSWWLGSGSGKGLATRLEAKLGLQDQQTNAQTAD